MRKARKIRDLEALCQKLLNENCVYAHTMLHISVPTDLGIRPIFQAYIDDAVLMTRLAGGNGLMPDFSYATKNPGLIVEVVNAGIVEKSRQDYRGDNNISETA